MRIRFLILFFGSLLLLAVIQIGCYKYSSDDCTPSDDCYIWSIDSGYVNIQLTYNDGNVGVPVILYDGYAEDNNIIWADTVYTDELTFWLPIKKRYAAEAYYSVGGQVTIALDGAKLKEDSYSDCGETCYEVSELDIDVKKL